MGIKYLEWISPRKMFLFKKLLNIGTTQKITLKYLICGSALLFI